MGEPRYYCNCPTCPGLSYKASSRAHPDRCGADLEAKIDKVLVFSTAHLAEEDMTYLEEQAVYASDGVVVHSYGSGLLVFVPDQTYRMPVLGRYFWTLYNLARHNGCRYIRFDTDGPVFPELPVFKW
jgi:hypothetical protein